MRLQLPRRGSTANSAANSEATCLPGLGTVAASLRVGVGRRRCGQGVIMGTFHAAVAVGACVQRDDEQKMHTLRRADAL